MPIYVVDADPNTIEGEFLAFYLQEEHSGRSISGIVFDILRTNSAAEDLDNPRAAIAGCLDSVLVQESEQKELLPLCKALSDIGLTCDEEQTKSEKGSKFSPRKSARARRSGA